MRGFTSEIVGEMAVPPHVRVEDLADSRVDVRPVRQLPDLEISGRPNLGSAATVLACTAVPGPRVGPAMVSLAQRRADDGVLARLPLAL